LSIYIYFIINLLNLKDKTIMAIMGYFNGNNVKKRKRKPIEARDNNLIGNGEREGGDSESNRSNSVKFQRLRSGHRAYTRQSHIWSPWCSTWPHSRNSQVIFISTFYFYQLIYVFWLSQITLLPLVNSNIQILSSPHLHLM
jgi:hypothetical protein